MRSSSLLLVSVLFFTACGAEDPDAAHSGFGNQEAAPGDDEGIGTQCEEALVNESWLNDDYTATFPADGSQHRFEATWFSLSNKALRASLFACSQETLEITVKDDGFKVCAESTDGKSIYRCSGTKDGNKCCIEGSGTLEVSSDNVNPEANSTESGGYAFDLLFSSTTGGCAELGLSQRWIKVVPNIPECDDEE